MNWVARREKAPPPCAGTGHRWELAGLSLPLPHPTLVPGSRGDVSRGKMVEDPRGWFWPSALPRLPTLFAPLCPLFRSSAPILCWAGQGPAGWGGLTSASRIRSATWSLNVSKWAGARRGRGGWWGCSHRTALDTLRVTLGGGFKAISWRKIWWQLPFLIPSVRTSPSEIANIGFSPETTSFNWKPMLLPTSFTFINVFVVLVSFLHFWWQNPVKHQE